jgi:hypothetical protein
MPKSQQVAKIFGVTREVLARESARQNSVFKWRVVNSKRLLAYDQL